jgi:hypothetical protein
MSRLEGFYRRREVLNIEEECIMFRERIVFPTALRTRVLKLFHQGHPGIQRMKSLVFKYAYWPGMDKDFENMVQRFSPCALAAKQPIKPSLHSWPPATKPWEQIHIDYAGPHLGKTFPHCRGCSFKISRCHSSTQHDVTTNSDSDYEIMCTAGAP